MRTWWRVGGPRARMTGAAVVALAVGFGVVAPAAPAWAASAAPPPTAATPTPREGELLPTPTDGSATPTPEAPLDSAPGPAADPAPVAPATPDPIAATPDPSVTTPEPTPAPESGPGSGSAPEQGNAPEGDAQVVSPATAPSPSPADAAAPAAPVPATGGAGGIAVDPAPLPSSIWLADARPAPGAVLLQTDPEGIDYAVDISWAPRAGTEPLGYRVELFTGRTVTNASALAARIEVPADTTSTRVEGVGFGATTITARVTLLDGATALPDPLISEPLSLPTASAGILSSERAGTPTLSGPTADGFTLTWTPAAGTPAPAGYAVRVLERRHDLAATSANSFIAETVDAGTATTAVLSGLHGSSRYLAAVVAYDLVDGVKRFRPSSAPSTVPAWSSEYVAQTLGARAPLTDWATPPAAPTADSAHSLTWTGTPTTGRYTGGAPVTGYRVELHRSGVGRVAETDVTVSDPSAAPTAVFRGLTPGATYSVRVAAVNAVGTGELSDFSALTTTPTTSAPGSRPPAFADRAALEAAIAGGSVAEYRAPGASGPVRVAQGDDVQVAIPWSSAQSGEAWWYGDRTFAATVVTDGTGTDPAHPTLTLPTTALPVGTHWVLFVTDEELDGNRAPSGGAATAVRVDVRPATTGVLTLDDAVLRWGLNDESNNGAYFGGCNFFSAGRTPDPGGSVIFTPAQYAASASFVSIEKPDASGRFVPASWETKCLDRTGAPLSSGTSTPYGGNQFVLSGGTGEVDRATGSASIRWTGDVTVAYYGGMSFWYLSDPVLTVENGSGTLTARVGGFGADMDDATKWQPLPDRVVTVATFSGVTVGADGLTATPDYRGVAVNLPAGQTAQARGGADWGSFPQSFIDFQLEAGAAAYWYSSGGQADAAKPAQPIVVGYDAATFAPPAAPADTAVKASAKAPLAKLPPAKLRPEFALAPAATTSTGPAAAAASSVVIVEQPAADGLSRTVTLLLVALIALLGLLVVIVAVGGGVVLLGTGAPERTRTRRREI